MTLIKSGIVTYQIDVPEADVRTALIFEAAEKHGLTHDGKLIPGVEGRVTRAAWPTSRNSHCPDVCDTARTRACISSAACENAAVIRPAPPAPGQAAGRPQGHPPEC